MHHAKRNFVLILAFVASAALAQNTSAYAGAAEIHPRLSLGASADGDRIERVIITLRDDYTLPLLPALNGDLPPGHPRNQEIRLQRAALIQRIQVHRGVQQATVANGLRARGARLVHGYWLMNGFLAEVPLRAIQGLANHPAILSIYPTQTDTPPPTVLQGRTIIRSDHIADQVGGGFFALLDTGVRMTHTLFQNSHPYNYYSPKFHQIYAAYDCVNALAGSNCASGTNLNPDDDWNHGTSSAAILVGHKNLGNDYRGVTDIYLNSYKVYTPPPSGGLNLDATVRGFEAAVAHGMDVIVAEMQSPDRTATNPIVIQANNAFDTGHAVIAAAGNISQVGTYVTAPGIARGAISVGAIDAFSGAQFADQTLGPGIDGRIKPDLQGPTNTTTASSAGTTALRSFGGTSGSTPYIGGAAAAIQRWLSWPSQKGKLYATMIALGDDLTPDNTTGAGVLRMPTGTGFYGDHWVVKTGDATVSHGQTVEVSFTPSALYSIYRDLDVAIWWSTDNCANANLALELVNPAGVVVASSNLPLSVWEKVRVAGHLAAGTWRIRIRGVNVVGSQQVFYSYIHRIS